MVTDLDMPEGLSEAGQRAHAIIIAYLAEHGRTETGDCKTFHVPSEWAQKHEYGGRSHLVIAYHSGSLSPVFSMDAAYELDCAHYRKTGKSREPYALYEGLQEKLHEAGLYFEECTRWYCAVYSTHSQTSDTEDAQS